MRPLLMFAAGLMLTQCTSGSGTVDLTGNWTYSATFQQTSPQVTCTTTSGGLTLVQSGPQVTGTYNQVAFSCTGAVTGSFGPYNGNVLSGTYTGGTIILSFDVSLLPGVGSSWQNTGHASNTSMSGSMQNMLTLDDTTVVMFGTFTSNKE